MSQKRKLKRKIQKAGLCFVCPLRAGCRKRLRHRFLTTCPDLRRWARCKTREQKIVSKLSEKR